MYTAYIESISLPADLTARASSRANFIAMGIVSFSQEGIKYQVAPFYLRFFLKNNIFGKLFWKYQVGQIIKYNDIINVQPFKNNCLELVTDWVNGSYYFSVPYSQSDSLSDIGAFIRRCQEEGFDRAVQDQTLFKKMEFHCVKAQKAMLIPAIILMLASLFISWYLNIFIGLLLAVFAPTFAKQSGSKILYTISLVLLAATLVLLIMLV